MATESGFSNQKKYGDAQFKTIQGVGSSKQGVNTAQMYLYDITPTALPIVDAVLDPDDNRKIIIEITGHGAKKGDVLRIQSPATLEGFEYDVVEVIDANFLAVFDLASEIAGDSIPQAADNIKICRWVTAKADSEGALTTSSGPIQYIKNGATQTVVEDTVTPSNTRTLPAGMYILKDGIAYPVGIDTVTPSNTVSVPVRLESATGPINITAGDLNVQLSDAGANFDATRIGDGSGIYLQVNADGSINVQDAAALAKLTTIAAVDFATGGKQDIAKAVLDAIKSNGDALNLKDFSTGGKQDIAKAVLDAIKSNGDTLNLKDFSTASNQTALAALTGSVTETAPATDTASSGLNGRLQRIAQRITSLMGLLPTSVGQKTMAASLAVTIASDQSSVPITVETLNQQSLTAGALNADLIPSTDVSKYAYLSLQVTGTWVGALTLQGSNDNVTWTAVNLQALSSGSSGVTNSISANSFAVAPIFFKYLRVRMTAYTSGTANGAAFFSVTGPDSLGADTVLQAGAWSVTTTASAVAGTVSSAQVSVGTTAVRATVGGTAPNAARKLLLIKPSKNNTGAIYIGPSTVTAANGMEILGPDRVEFDFDAGDYYLISDTVGQTVEILEKI